jgi:hypothetical protein
LPVSLLAFALASCSGGNPPPAGNQAAAPGGPATLSVSLMDAPVDDVYAVNLVITGLWLKAEGDGPAEEILLSDSPIEANLLTLTNDNPALLVQNAVIEPGTYAWLELEVDADIDGITNDSHVIEDEGGGMFELFVPSGRVKLIENFEVGEAEAVELLFDWDVRSGLVLPPGLGGPGQTVYLLKPVIRVIGVSHSSTLSGTIAMGTIDDADNDCHADDVDAMDPDVGNVVYLFEGLDVEPYDIDEPMGNIPVATISAVADSDGYAYSTTLGEGLYTVAFTCQASNDMPETDDTIQFLPTTYNITVDGTAADFTADF